MSLDRKNVVVMATFLATLLHQRTCTAILFYDCTTKHSTLQTRSFVFSTEKY